MTRVVIATDAVEQLAAIAPAQALLVMDVNTRQAAGLRVAAALAAVGSACSEVVLGGDVRAGPRELSIVSDALGEDEDRVAVAVGSGVITDVVRWAVHERGRDFISVPTAASMDGYASGVAALEVDGVKVTRSARAPSAIFADPRVSAAAPRELTRAGVGDLLAKVSARVDWLASHLLYGEPFVREVADRVLESVRSAALAVDELLTGGADASAALLRGLVESGTAMAIVGSSRPASGCEHHASHFWDLLAARGRRAYAPHGLQVGYATRFAIRLQRYAFGGGVRELRRPVPVRDPLGAQAREWLGEPTAEILAAVEDKQRFAAAIPPEWPATAGGWEAVRAGIAPSVQMFDVVDGALAAVGIPGAPGYLGLDERTLRATFRHATRLRARYTTVDFLEGQGMLDEALDEAFASPRRSPPDEPLTPTPSRSPPDGPDR